MPKTQRITNFTRDQLTFNVIDSGPIKGKPVVLLHGFPETAKSWDKVSHILNKNGFRTYAIEQRGYSPLARPKGRLAYRTTELVEDVVTFIQSLDEQVYLMGHDWGAAVAGDVAMAYPHYIKHLTLVSVPHKGAFIKAMFTSRQFFQSYYMALFQLPIIPELLFNKVPAVTKKLLGNSGMTDEQIAHFKQDFLVEKRLSTALNWYRGMPLTKAGNPFQKISVPSLYVWGKADIALSRKGAELNKNYFSGEYKEHFMDATHWIPNQNADELADYFLKAVA